MRASSHTHDPSCTVPAPLSIIHLDAARTLPPSTIEAPTPDRLNIAERFAARVGEWVGALSAWWTPEYAPPIAGDAHLSALCVAFAAEPEDYCCP